MKILKEMSLDEQTAFYKAMLKEVGFLALLGLFLMTFYSSCYQPHRIPSGSMIPTLVIGDYILVDKSAYGLKLPFTENWESPIYLTEKLGPSRGEVVVFKYPENPRLNYIKRLLGVPGDTLEMIDHEWWINGERLPLMGPNEIEDPNDWIEQRFFEDGLLSYDTVTGVRAHQTFMKESPKGPANIQSFTLREDEYFFVGDNRDFSEDSRHWGVVDRSLIRGRAMFVWFNLNSPFSRDPFRAKWSRIGTKL